MADYIKWLRAKVVSEPIFLNAASGLIVNERGEFLLQRRGGGEKEGAWSIPGGIMEIGEFAQDTVKRELLEETGLEVEIGRLIGVYTSPELVTSRNGDKSQMVTQFFVCRAVGGTLRPDGDETLELKYFTSENRPKMFRPHIERALRDYEVGNFGISN
jgi:ADP-ribose pyrophosphatase YjhB (NUDIX family)